MNEIGYWVYLLTLSIAMIDGKTISELASAMQKVNLKINGILFTHNEV
jgi:hypothetical protein